MPPAQLIGLDVGTTSCKAGLFDDRGEVLALASAGYSLQRPAPGHVEQDPETYWTAAVRCLRDVMASATADPHRVRALASCGQAPTLVLIDRHGRPVRPAILWQDTRAAAEAESLARDPGTETLARWYGVRWPVDASMPLARFRWLQRHEPDALARTACVLLPKDFVHLRLTGRATTDPWSAKGLIHQDTCAPIVELRDACGLDLSIVPAAVPPAGIAGTVTADAATTTGLRPGTPVVAGWTDAMAAMLGSGGFEETGFACDVSGTSEVVGLTLPERPAHTGPLIAAAIAASPWWTLYGPTQASGASLGWALQTLYDDAGAIERALADAAGVPAGAGGVLFLPYLQGERAPLWDPGARGAFLGLTTAHDRRHLIRAVLEGVAFSVYHVLSAAQSAAAIAAVEVRAAGGGARLTLWNQIKADVAGLPFRPAATTENGVLGAAMLAALGAGLFATAGEASRAMVHAGDPIAPDHGRHAEYAALFARYVECYPRLRDLFRP